MSEGIILVTGGAGFIGSHVVRALLSRGEAVRVLDDFSSGTHKNLADATEAEVVTGDIRDAETVRRAMSGVRVAYHIAANPSVPGSVADPYDTHQRNATGTLTVLMAARGADLERLVYASSSAVYGDADMFPTAEDAEMKPVSPYGASKLAGEFYCRSFTQVYGFPTVSLRYFNVFGPGQDVDSYYVVPRFVRALLFGEAVQIEGDGAQSRDFVYVEDVVEATLLAGTAGSEAFGRAFNVGSGQRASIMKILELLEGITSGRRPEIQWKPPRVGDVHDTHANIDWAGRYLGYQPKFDLSAGLKATVEWLGPRMPQAG